MSGLSLLLEGALRGSMVLLAAAAATLALRRSSAAVRHLVWTAGIAAVLLVLPAAHVTPPWRVAVPEPLAPLARMAATIPVTQTTTPAAPLYQPQSLPAPTPAASPWAVRLTVLWLAGAVCLAASFLVAAVRLASILRDASPLEDPRIRELACTIAARLGVSAHRFQLRWTSAQLTPMTWGLWRHVILLPEACVRWEEERLEQILVHEIAHVSRHDTWTQAMACLATVVYWFNPLVWWAARRMLVERERACDDRVLAAGAKPSTYAHELLEIARALGARWTAARVSPAMARRSQISGRLLAVLDPDVPRHAASRAALVASVFTGLAILLPLAAVAPVPAVIAAEPSRRLAEVNLEDAQSGLAAAQRAFDDALSRRDPVAMAAIYTEDAIAMVPGVLPMRGRRAIQDGLRLLLTQGITGMKVRTLELYPLTGLVCQVGEATYVTSSGDTHSRRFMTLWKPEDGQWRIIRDYATP